MKEGLKSILLVMLIGISLSFSYLLWESEPTPLPLVPAKYELPAKIGEQETWEDLLQPNEVVLHLGDNRHTVIFPTTPEYTLLWRSLKELQFFRLTEVSPTTDDWKALLERRTGIEYNFRNPLPVPLLRKAINIPKEIENDLSTVNKIWITNDPERNTVYLLSAKEGKVFQGEIGKPSNPSFIDIPQLLSMGTKKEEWIPLLGESPGSWDYLSLRYLPKNPLEIMTFHYELTRIGEQEMARSLFLDLSITREITERDGSRIFTDGIKSLQTNPSTGQMRYYVPGYEVQGGATTYEDPAYLLEFMNQHQGWTGQYVIDQADLIVGNTVLRFRQQVRGLSLYDQDEKEGIGIISIKGTAGHPSEYIRSLFRLGKLLEQKKTTLPSGLDLMHQLEKEQIPLYKIGWIELGYHMLVDKEKKAMRLSPSYVVKVIGEEKLRFYDSASLQKGGV